MCSPLELVQSLTNWTDKVSFLYKQEVMADCYFVIGEGEELTRIPAHKFVLSGCCYEFFKLFYVLESDSKDIVIPVNDFGIEILYLFLGFVYNIKDNLFMSLDNAWEILRIARFYGADSIILKCEYFIGNNITEENVFEYLNKSSAVNLSTVNLMCMNFIERNNLKLAEHPTFLDLHSESLLTILKSDKLSDREINIYHAVNHWTEYNLSIENVQITSENKRDMLGPALKEIRFGFMTYEEFNECTEDENSFLTKDEMVDIYKSIGTRRNCGFKMARRTPYMQPEICRRLSSHLSRTICATGKEIHFSVDTDIICCGLGLYGMAPYDYTDLFDNFSTETVFFSIEYKDGPAISQNQATITEDGSDKIYNVFFKDEVLLKKNILYAVIVKREHPCSFFFSAMPESNVTLAGVEFRFRDMWTYYQDSTTANILFKNVC